MAKKGKTASGSDNALSKLKFEIAAEQGINLKEGENKEISAKDAGRIGGNMVRRMIKMAEQNMQNMSSTQSRSYTQNMSNTQNTNKS